MRGDYAPEILAALKASPFRFSDSPGALYLTRGRCPQCNDDSLFVAKEKPFVICCNHRNSCGYAESVREALPELFEEFSRRFPTTRENPRATADAYLGFNRCFDLSRIRGWYEQGTYPIEGTNRHHPTVRFYLDPYNTRYWERLIEGANRHGKKAHFGGKRKPDGTLYRGDVWTPPGQTLERLEECYLVEGIFHAIALHHAGYKAAAAFSCDHFPQDFIAANAKKGVQWVLALDSDKAGRGGMRKHHALLKKMGELSGVCLTPPGKDWDDLWREGQITRANLAKWKHHGRLFLAESVEEKAYYSYLRSQKGSYILDFENSLFAITIGTEFSERFEGLVEAYRAEVWQERAAEHPRERREPKTRKGRKTAGRAQTPEPAAPEPAAPALTEPGPAAHPAPERDIESGPEAGADPAGPDLEPAPAADPDSPSGPEEAGEKDARQRALLSPEGRKLFYQHVQVQQIANVRPTFLYMQRNEIMDEQHYVFSIDYANGQSQDIIPFEGTALTTPDALHKALLNRSRAGTFDGDARHLKKLRSWWFDKRMLTVGAVPYIGYEKSLGAYIFQEHAWHNGKRQKVNGQGYFTIGREGIKSSLQGLPLNTGGDFSPEWIDNFAKAFSWQGMAVLSFWLGSLFVQQIRAIHKAFPFLELTGEPGAGKSTLLEFLWKLLGRDHYEGFDLLKSSAAGRRRAFSQVSNLPVVIIESDRDNGDKDARQKQFGFDEVKSFYNGRGTGTLGVARRGNETDESLFQGSLVISQNAEVDGSEALLQRIVHCHADKRHHTAESQELARWFERQTSDTVGGFLGAALSRERQILETYERAFPAWEKEFSAGGLKNRRIIQNHAQVAACAEALRLVFPKMSDRTVEGIGGYLRERALARETRIAADHPSLEAFWEICEYINNRAANMAPEYLNHSQNWETLLAINLNHFREKCLDYNQAHPDMSLLKKLLPYTKRYKFIEANRAVASRVDHGRTVKCWIFEKGGKP